MNPLSRLMRGPAADVIARFGTPVTISRPTGTFDPDAQAMPAGMATATVPAILHRRTVRAGGDAARSVDIFIAMSALARAGFPAPRPGDRLAVDGEELPVVEVETHGAGAGAGLHVLKAGR